MESKINEGSTFSFALPIIEPAVDERETEPIEYVNTE
jgi:hypothetical protein